MMKDVKFLKALVLAVFVGCELNVLAGGYGFDYKNPSVEEVTRRSEEYGKKYMQHRNESINNQLEPEEAIPIPPPPLPGDQGSSKSFISEDGDDSGMSLIGTRLNVADYTYGTQEEKVSKQVDHGLHLSNKSQELIQAVKDNDYNKVNELTHKGVDVNHQDEQGKTALHYAVQHKDTSVLKKLLDQPSVKSDVKDDEGKTALDHAKEQGNVPAQLSLEYAADPDDLFSFADNVEQQGEGSKDSTGQTTSQSEASDTSVRNFEKSLLTEKVVEPKSFLKSIQEWFSNIFKKDTSAQKEGIIERLRKWWNSPKEAKWKAKHPEKSKVIESWVREDVKDPKPDKSHDFVMNGNQEEEDFSQF